MRYPVTYTRLFARHLRLDPQQLNQLLAGTSIRPEDLQELKPSLSLEEQLRVVHNAISLAERSTFALEVASRLSLAAHGYLGTLLFASKNLNQAWHALARYHMLRLPLVELSVHYHDDAFEVFLSPQKSADDVMIVIMECLMLTIQRGIELVLGRKLTEARFEFAYPAPDYALHYAQFFNSPCVFSASGFRMTMPLALMEQQNPFHDERMYQQALDQCEQLLAQRRVDENSIPWQDRVSRVLREHSGRLWTGNEIAGYFQISGRTLIRYLKAEQTSYQTILDQELARQALEYLQTSRHTVESTALALGYRDATAFRRAFHRWYGMSPSSYLRQSHSDCQH
jgi:AraC-like DNA-binding protein